ncbi:telomere repeats-binding bouquet formation protein 2 [Leptosomus discolor]
MSQLGGCAKHSLPVVGQQDSLEPPHSSACNASHALETRQGLCWPQQWSCYGLLLPPPLRLPPPFRFPPPSLRPPPPAAAMFRGRRAWFSGSVSTGPRELWAAGGGALAPWRDADYLFSSDAAHPDTRRIHESLNYLEGRATVFHSRYLSAWASTGTGAKPSVVLGHFVLPPACLQEGPSENLMDELVAARKSCEEEAEEDVLDLAERYFPALGITWSQVTFGVSRLLRSGKYAWKRLRMKQGPLVLLSSSRHLEEQKCCGCDWNPSLPLRALHCPSRQRGQLPSPDLPFPFVGYTAARDMKKYVGELRDFIPGTSGYTAYWIQNEINIYSDGKTRTKRKL